jgi:hypothetical protein
MSYSDPELRRKVTKILRKQAAMSGGAYSGGAYSGGAYSVGDFSDILNSIGSVAQTAMKFAPLLGLGKKNKKGKKGGASLLGGPGSIRQYELAAGLSGGSFLDDIPGIGQIAGLLGLGMSGGKRKKVSGGKRAPTKRNLIVKQVMQQQGMSLPQASHYVKVNGLA